MPREQQDYSTTNTQVLSSKALGNTKLSHADNALNPASIHNTPAEREKLVLDRSLGCPNPSQLRVETSAWVSFVLRPCNRERCAVCGPRKAKQKRREIMERAPELADFARFNLGLSLRHNLLDKTGQTEEQMRKAAFNLMGDALREAVKDLRRASKGYHRFGNVGTWKPAFFVERLTTKDIDRHGHLHLHTLLFVKETRQGAPLPTAKYIEEHFQERFNYHLYRMTGRCTDYGKTYGCYWGKSALGKCWLKDTKTLPGTVRYLLLAPNSGHWEKGNYRIPRGTRRVSRSQGLRPQKPKKTA